MSTYANQSIPNLERKLGQMLMKHRELDLANRREEMVEVSTIMSDIALAINTKKLSARLINGKSDCRAFKKYGSCKRGNRCIWKHNPIYKREYGSVANHAQEEKSEEVAPAQKVAHNQKVAPAHQLAPAQEITPTNIPVFSKSSSGSLNNPVST